MNTEQVRRIVVEGAIEIDGVKKMPCKRAFELAGEYSISLKEIGRCCNENNIRISGCQLGCFE